MSHAACDISSFCVVGDPFGCKICFELKDLGGVEPASWLGVEQTLVALNGHLAEPPNSFKKLKCVCISKENDTLSTVRTTNEILFRLVDEAT